jgi:hypothetical protein
MGERLKIGVSSKGIVMVPLLLMCP